MSRFRPLLLTLILVVALTACATAVEERKYWREDAAITPAPELSRFNTLLADLADQLKPALVHVRVRRAPGQDKEEDGPGEPRRSTGSGFIIDPSGLIVTNAHVVEDADWLQVRLSDGRRFSGQGHRPGRARRSGPGPDRGRRQPAHAGAGRLQPGAGG